MNIFQTHAQIVQDYGTYIRSFLLIADPKIRELVENELRQGKLWPEPLLQFNPSFAMAGSVDDLIASSHLHPALSFIFKGYSLYRHQADAIRLGLEGRDFIVTSGTGSGKSLTYIGSIFHYLFNNPDAAGVTGVVVYPMNALINSQFEEFKRYRDNFENATGKPFPITFGKFTGQEKEEKRQEMREHRPHILLTNYMMLELLLTRIRERSIREAIYDNLRFLVFDELHTYRGRQGADVAMLIRRIRARCTNNVCNIGTSATMVSGGSLASQRAKVAEVATVLFGRPFHQDQVVTETLARSLSDSASVPGRSQLAAGIFTGASLENSTNKLKAHPVAVWLENCIALLELDGHLLRRKPQRMSEVVARLATDSGLATEQCKEFLITLLQSISSVNQTLQAAGHRYTILPFKLHQFISQTGSVYATLDQDAGRFLTLEPGVYKQDEEGKKAIYPNVFSRASGQAFICVARVGNQLLPREFREISEEEETTDGYLIVGDDIWDPTEDLENLPDSWLLKSRKGPNVKKKPFFPVKLFFDETGQCRESPPLKWWGWFMKAPLLFDPTAGVFFDTKTNEGTKLTKLGSEGRSTSTTIAAFSILKQLDEAGYHPANQKLLSFTDNRQDAALQAGHFNDFVQVVRLRAAIHKALLNAPEHTITFATLGEELFKALDLPFLEEQSEMVAGAVQPPRIDLCNQELLLTHLNALAISEIGLPGLEEQGNTPPSILRFIEDDNHLMPLASEVRAGLDLHPATFNAIQSLFKQVIRDFAFGLESKAAGWFSEQWVEQNLSGLADHLDSSLGRWRSLHRSARTILTRATQHIESGTLSLGSEEYRKYKRNQDQATRQLDLLRNSYGGRTTSLSEFYPYRYLASEGFLPGYNFTRLPLRVFLPTVDSSGEYISRPRAIALREFGPLNIIYHNGRKYRVSQLVMQDTEASQSEARISKKSGYFLPPDQNGLEICPFTGIDLSDHANTEYLHHLLEMTESRAEEVDRISCEEEERVSRGFEIKTYFSVDGGQLERIKKAKVLSTENILLNLRFIPAARLIHVNYRWRAQQADGFPVGMVSGDWRSSMPKPEDNFKEDFRLVKLWTSNLADALYIEPVQPLGLTPEGVITLQHALKRAIETVFQIESGEIGVVAVGSPEAPNILLFEAAEGSLGILSQFVENIEVFLQVIRQAYSLCRFDDEKYKAPASYDDLLSYYNQRDHRTIDRHLIKDALAKLLICTIEIESNRGFTSYEEHYQTLRRSLDLTSSTELKFLTYLYENGLRLPDAAQKRVEGIFVQPDFYYEPRIWIFCDGTPHDSPAVQADDETKRQAIMARGDEVWVYSYRDNLAEKISGRPDIFRKVR